MTEHSASVFVFFFLGEYSSLILMSAFMSVFFLGGHYCPDLHNLLIDPFIYIYNYLYPVDVSSGYSILMESYYQYLSFNHIIGDEGISLDNFDSNTNDEFAYFINVVSGKDVALQSINILIDKVYGSFILGFKIITVVFFFI